MSFRPPSTTKEAQKRLTPQARKTPGFLNATTSSGAKVTAKTNTARGKAKQLEGTFSIYHPSDKVITNSANVTCLSQTLVSPGIDWEQECDDAYNDYLQALFKQTIVKAKVTEVKNELSEQLASHSESLFKDKLEVQRLEMEEEIQKESSKIVEAIHLLKGELSGFKRICEDCNLEQSLDTLIELFNEVKDRVTLENVLQFNSQEDYDKLAANLSSVTMQLEKILKDCDKEDKLAQLAEQLQSILCLKEEVVNKEARMEKFHIDLGFLVLKNLSDYFDGIRKEE